MSDRSEALEKAVQFIRDRAEKENKTVDEIIDELEKYEQKKIKETQMQARDKRKQARAESNLKKIERTKRNHQLIKMGAALSSILGRTLSDDDEFQKLFDFYSIARTADGKTVKDFFQKEL